MALSHEWQVLEASDGAKAAGWPAFHKSTVHTSPLMYDLDFDGVQDILLATYGGEILAFRDNVRHHACVLAYSCADRSSCAATWVQPLGCLCNQLATS
jgi:hypothetical protein